MSEGSDMLLVGARSAGGDIVTEAVKVGGCNAVKAEVSNGVRARGGGIVAEVAETGGCNAVGAAVAGWWGCPCAWNPAMKNRCYGMQSQSRRPWSIAAPRGLQGEPGILLTGDEDVEVVRLMSAFGVKLAVLFTHQLRRMSRLRRLCLPKAVLNGPKRYL